MTENEKVELAVCLERKAELPSDASAEVEWLAKMRDKPITARDTDWLHDTYLDLTCPF
jgi:hypothetical protein